MERKHLRILLVAVALMVSALACEGSFSTASIQDAYMSLDADGNSPTTTYSQDAVFYAQVDLANAPDDTVLKAVWTVVDAEETDPNLVINETEFISSDGLIHFDLENTDYLWPIGEYKVDIYLNDTLDRTLTFYVE